jgi:hypothetical protein
MGVGVVSAPASCAAVRVTRRKPQMSDAFFFVLKRSGWGFDDLYEAIKSGEKTSEWRDASEHWIKRLLLMRGDPHFVKDRGKPYDYKPKCKKAIFVVGFTKYPRLIADVKALLYHPKTNQFEVQIENVVEIKQ